MEDFLAEWGYLGVFLALVGTGLGLPMPEELPVVAGGAFTGTHPDILRWYLMLPVTIAGVIVGDGFLYTIGRFWGPKLLQYDWIKRRVFPPARLAKIEENFQVYGVKLLLFARLTPGVRAPIFFTAGMTRLPLSKFLLADGLYAIPGVSILFFLGWWFGDSVVDFVAGPFEKAKSVIAIVVILAIAGYLVYRAMRKPMVTGDPHEMPPLVEQVTHKLEQVTSKIIHPKHTMPHEPAHPSEPVPPPGAELRQPAHTPPPEPGNPGGS